MRIEYEFTDLVLTSHAGLAALAGAHSAAYLAGAAALYLLALVVVTSYYRREIGRAPWKVIHYAAYAVAILSYVHGILTDPTLTDKAVDLLDAEKVSVELCLVLALAATAVRMHGRWRKYTQERDQAALRRAAPWRPGGTPDGNPPSGSRGAGARARR